jgi:TraG-like protein, N-terminal region
MRNRKLLLLVLLVIVALPALSYAGGITMEYKVYSGYDAVYMAFRKISLIFNSQLYTSLFMGIVGIGAAVTLLGTALQGIGGRANYGQAVAMFITGMVIFATLFIKTGPGSGLQFFDPIKNTTAYVKGLPDGIVILAGTLNKIEMAVIQFIIDNGDTGVYGTYGSKLAYTNNPGGLGFSLIEAATGKVRFGPNDFTLSLNQYVKDCYMPGFAIPGTGIFINDLTDNAIDLRAQLSKAAFILFHTTIYDLNTGANGQDVSCFDAWNNAGAWGGNGGLNGYLTERIYEGASPNNTILKQICGTAGYDITNMNSLQNCSDVLTAVYKQSNGGASGFLTNAGSGSALGWQALMAQSIAGTASLGNTGATAGMQQNQSIMSSGIGAMANEWLPVGKAVMTAVAICLMPILVLFLLTPAWPKALGTIIGFFVWIAAWGMTDALTHSIALDYTLSYMTSSLNNGGIGMTDLMTLPSASAKAMAMFGFIRGSGAALATMLAGLVTAYGGHALGGIASGSVENTQGQSKQSNMRAASHDGQMQIQQQGGSAAAITAMHGGYQNAYAAAAWSESNKLSAGAWSYENRGGVSGGVQSGGIDAMKSLDGQESFKGGMAGAGSLGSLLKQDHRQGFQDKSMTGQKVDFNDKVHNEIKGDMVSSLFNSSGISKLDFDQNKDGIQGKINSQAESAAWQFQAIGGSSMKPGEAYSNYEGLKKAAEKTGTEFNPFDATKKILDQHAGQAGGKELSRTNAEKVTGTPIPTAEWNMIQNSGGSATWMDKDGRTHTARQTSLLGNDGKPTGSELDLTTKGLNGTETRKSMRMDTDGTVTQTAVAETKNGSAVKLGSMQQADGKTEITDVGKELVTGSITEGRSAAANAIATQSLAKTTGNTEQWSEAMKAGLSSTKSSEFANNLNWATSEGLKSMENRNVDMSDSTKKAANTAMSLAGKAGIGLNAGPNGLSPSGAITGNMSAEEKRSFEHAVSVINKDSASSGHDWGKTVSDSYSEATKKAWSKTFSADDTKQIAHQIGISDVDQINNAKQIANKLDMNVTGTEAQVKYLGGLNHEAAGGDHKFASKPSTPERVEEIASWVAKNPGQHKSEFQNFLQDISGLGEVASLKTILNDTKPAVDYRSHASGETQGVQALGEKTQGKVDNAVAPAMKEVAPARTAGGVKPVNKNHFLENMPTDIASAKPVIAQNNAAKATKDMKDSSTWSEPVAFKLTDTNPGDNHNSTFFSTVTSGAKVPIKGPAPKDSYGNTLGPAYSTLGGPAPKQYNVTNPGGWSAPGVGYGANNSAPKN